MSHTLVIVLFIDEVMRVHLEVLHLLPLILTHQLCEGAVELFDISGKELSIAEYLKE